MENHEQRNKITNSIGNNSNINFNIFWIMSEIKKIAVITPLKREFDIYSRDNEIEDVKFVHVFKDDHIRGIRFNSIIKLYRWFDIKGVDEIIYNINRRIV